MARLAFVQLREGLSGERPRLWAEVEGRRRAFPDLPSAATWAARRADRVRVLVDGLGRWEDWPVEEADLARIERHVERRLRRFDREHGERRSEAVEWFYAVRDPDVEDVTTLGSALAAQPAVLAVRRRGPWWVVTVRARTASQAMAAGSDAFIRVAWPPARMDRELGEDATWFVTHGGESRHDLAEYEDETLGTRDAAG